MAVSQSLTLTLNRQDVASNISYVRMLWTSTQSGQSFNNYTRTAKYYVSINGGAETEYSVSYTLPKGTTTTIADVQLTVPHNSDGTATVAVRTWMDTDISAGTITKSASLTPTTIARATTPTFYQMAVDMGDTQTIYTYRADASFKHDLAYSIAGGGYVTFATNVDTVYYWAVPDLSTSLPGAVSSPLTVRCITKKNGTTIGTKYASFIVSVPDDVVPVIGGLTLTKVASGTTDPTTAFVQNKSGMNVKIYAEGVKGSFITSYRAAFLGKTYQAQSFKVDNFTDYGRLPITVTVTDSRGRSASLTEYVDVLEYYTPVVAEFLAWRSDEEGGVDTEGNFLSVSFDYHVAPLDGDNTGQVVIDYKRTTATTWEAALFDQESSKNSGVIFFTEKSFPNDYQYDVRLTLTDGYGETATYIATLPTAEVILDIKANGKGIAFGKTAELDGFEVAMPPNGESINLLGVMDYELGDSYGHILYNNGLLLQWGSVAMMPAAVNDVISASVKFPYRYKTRPHISGTIMVNSPQVVSWSMGVGTTNEGALEGLVIYMNRSTLHSTPFRWMAVGLADMTEVLST